MDSEDVVLDLINHTLIANKKLKGFDRISDFGVEVLVDMVKKFAKQMCDKQKEICVEEYIDNIYDIRDESTDIWGVDIIQNAPYPEELR